MMEQWTLSVAVHSWEMNGDLPIYCILKIGLCFLYCQHLTASISDDHNVVPIMQLIRCADYVDEATCHSNLHKSHNPTPTSAQTHHYWSKCHRLSKPKSPNLSYVHPSTQIISLCDIHCYQQYARLVHVVHLSMWSDPRIRTKSCRSCTLIIVWPSHWHTFSYCLCG